MFGQNPIRKVDHSPDDGKLAVQSIFYTLQGEGPFSGVPAVFIRLAGCHLACTFCDTEFESGINNRMLPQEIAQDAVRKTDASKGSFSWGNSAPIVVLTGGEPLRQSTGDLVHLLLAAGFSAIQYETAGNLWDPSLDRWVRDLRIHFVVSPKTPVAHPKIQEVAKHWKYVVRASDYMGPGGLPASPTQKHGQRGPYSLAELMTTTPAWAWDKTIWISPCDEHDPELNRQNRQHAVDLCLKFGYRLNLQIHKIVELE